MRDEIDDELLSALLASRVKGEERERLLAHLLNNEADYEVFTDTVDILREAEEDGVPDATPHSPAARRGFLRKPLYALFTAMATSASRVRRWMVFGKRGN